MPDDQNLIATWVNIIELACAHPLNKPSFSFKEWRAAIEAIACRAKETFVLSPYEYMLDSIFEGLAPSKKVYDVREILARLLDQKQPISNKRYWANVAFFQGFYKAKRQFVESLIGYKQNMKAVLADAKTFKEEYKLKQNDQSQFRALETLYELVLEM